jgi:outer membrane protein W
MKKIVSSTLIVLSTTFVVAEEPKVAVDSNVTEELNVTKVLKIDELKSQRVYNTGIKLGTLGLGLDISTPINDKLSARFNLNGATYTDTQEEDDNEYEGTLDLLTAGVLLDYYPFENNFRLSTGLYYNGNGFDGTIVPTSTTTIDIDGKEYTTDDINRLNSDVSFQNIAPYVGLGWGSDAHDNGWGFTIDLGVIYHGKADVNLEADIKDLARKEEIDAAVKKEEQSVEDDLNDFQFYPVVMIGANYSF